MHRLITVKNLFWSLQGLSPFFIVVSFGFLANRRKKPDWKRKEACLKPTFRRNKQGPEAHLQRVSGMEQKIAGASDLFSHPWPSGMEMSHGALPKKKLAKAVWRFLGHDCGFFHPKLLVVADFLHLWGDLLGFFLEIFLYMDDVFDYLGCDSSDDEPRLEACTPLVLCCSSVSRCFVKHKRCPKDRLCGNC